MNNKYLTIAEKQKASLDTLLFVDDFCRNNGIRYYLAYGTLIGAVRHNGFIPWDDDVDLHIPRPDYERLVRTFYDPNGVYKLVTPNTDKDYILPFAKVQNTKTARVIWDKIVDHQGIGIDLFPLDGIPDDLSSAEKAFKKQNNKWLKVTNRLERFRFTKPNGIVSRLKNFAGNMAYISGYSSKSIIKMSQSPLKTDYDSANWVGTVVGIHSGKFRPFHKEWFDACEVEYEGYMLIAPKGYDKILSSIYGDYMQLPPENNRVTTHTDKFIWLNNER